MIPPCDNADETAAGPAARPAAETLSDLAGDRTVARRPLPPQLLDLLPPVVQRVDPPTVPLVTQGPASSPNRWGEIAATLGFLLWEMRAEPGGTWGIRVSPALRQVLSRLDDSRDPTEAWAAGVHPADRRRVRDHLHRAARSGVSELSYRLVARDGTVTTMRSRVVVAWAPHGEMVVCGAGTLLDRPLRQ